LEARQLSGHFFGQDSGHERKDLANFHHGALHFAHGSRDIFGGAHERPLLAALASFAEGQVRGSPASGSAARQAGRGDRAAQPVGGNCPLFQGLDSRA
jgi:hypothetical protein